ncbi:MAG: protein jag [Oscillospiraceae bacterium]|jgi:spoIIIJ-associated protein|nr:protein jag [Oscillospiraceae bacterium]
MAIETTGKTIEIAIAAALRELNTDRDSVTVEVLENPKPGFLGLGGSPAKVLVKMIGEEDPPQGKETPNEPAKEAKKKPVKQPASPPVTAPPAANPQPAKAAASQGGGASVILKGVLDRMGLTNASVEEIETEHHLLLNVTGQNLGRLIGRRGETLDAVQRIVSAAYNRGLPERRRIVIDAEKYRAKREEALAALAVSTAEKVVKYNRDMLLEPMNAYSRHIVHTALQDNPYVTTHSVGNEPQRRVIISLSGAKKAAPPRR